MIGSLWTPHLVTQVPQVVYGAKGVKHWISAIRRGDIEERGIRNKEKRKKKRRKKKRRKKGKKKERRKNFSTNSLFNFDYNHECQKATMYQDITLSHNNKMKSSSQKTFNLHK